MIRQLTRKVYHQGLNHLQDCDADLAKIVADHGPPPMWARKPGFPTLIQIILEQQVSLASGRATYGRLLAAATPLVPEQFLTLKDGELKRIGFSRQKSDYCRDLSRAVLEGRLLLEKLPRLDDAAVRTHLTAMKGIGPWTADIYLLMALRRPDAWPVHDLALAVAAQKVKRLRSLPTPEKLDRLSKPWRPWRAVAARILWHYYLRN